MNIFGFNGSLWKRILSGASFDPVRDWLILLALSFIVLAGIIVWNVWAFGTVASGGTIIESTAQAPTAFTNSSLDTIHSIFTSRAEEEEKNETGIYRYADPSL